jgi:hypothetical protein
MAVEYTATEVMSEKRRRAAAAGFSGKVEDE